MTLAKLQLEWDFSILPFIIERDILEGGLSQGTQSECLSDQHGRESYALLLEEVILLLLAGEMLQG